MKEKFSSLNISWNRACESVTQHLADAKVKSTVLLLIMDSDVWNNVLQTIQKMTVQSLFMTVFIKMLSIIYKK